MLGTVLFLTAGAGRTLPIGGPRDRHWHSEAGLPGDQGGGFEGMADQEAGPCNFSKVSPPIGLTHELLHCHAWYELGLGLSQLLLSQAVLR